MPLTANDLANKFRIVPGAVTVTLTPANPTGAPITVSGARKRPLSGDEAMSLGISINVDTTFWFLPTINLGGYSPTSGDKITDPAGTDWITTPTGISGLMEAEWKLFCTKAV